MKQRTQREPSDADQSDEGQRRLGESGQKGGQKAFGLPSAKHADGEQDRSHREILEQQTEKLARPTGVVSRFCSANIGITTAVDDRASATPTRPAAAGANPSATRAALSARDDTITCSDPRPNTRRRRVRRRSHDSSMPIMKSKNTTPNS